MKRKNLENKKENKFSENFFSNKILRENNTMKLEISQKFIVNEKEFTSMKEVNKYLLENLISSTTIEEIIENPEKYISEIRKYTSSTPEKSKNNSRNISKKNLVDINEYLKKNFNSSIDRLSNTTKRASDWPVYLINTPNNLFTFRYTRAVFELYEEIVLESSIENFVEKYKYSI